MLRLSNCYEWLAQIFHDLEVSGRHRTWLLDVWWFRCSGMTTARLVAGFGPGVPLVGRVGGAFRLVGAVGLSLWRGGQGVDLVPGQDEIRLVRVGAVEADQPSAGAAHEAGGHVEQRPA